MRKIRIITVGKTQDKYIRDGVAVFEKKLKHYCELNLVVVKEANYANGSAQQWNQEEGQKLIKLMNPRHFTICCDEKGSSFDSIQLANAFQNWSNTGYSTLDFLIGGAFGFSDEVRSKANIVLSLSPMTLTHQMVRLFLIEQVYRAFTIIRNEKYHH